MAIVKCTKYHDCNRLPINKFPIEKILHHIWVRTHEDLQSDSNEIKEKNIANIIDQYQKLQGFRPMFWVNDESLYPNTIAQLKNLGAEILNINVLKNFNIDIYAAKICLEKGYVGGIVDWLKYEIVKTFGGVVLDVNFRLHYNNISKIFDLYSFITLTSLGVDDDPENFFIAASRDHQILKIISNELKFDRPDYCPTASITYGTWVSTVVTKNMYRDGEVNEVFAGRNCSIETKYGWNTYIGSDGKENSWATDEDQ